MSLLKVGIIVEIFLLPVVFFYKQKILNNDLKIHEIRVKRQQGIF